MNKLIKQIKNKKIPCYFISPHLDDAALSSGELMRKLSKFTKVFVVNIFTSVDTKCETHTAKNALKGYNFSSAEELYKERVLEDKKALATINVQIINLNFIEAVWRKINSPTIIRKILSFILPEIIHVYPTYRLHIAKGKISRYDHELINRINKRLRRIISKKALVFCPIGYGSHVDHLITRAAVEKSFTPIYWVDQPYFKYENLSRAKTLFETGSLFKSSMSFKKELLSYYKTQLNSLFPNKRIPVLNERFILKNLIIL